MPTERPLTDLQRRALRALAQIEEQSVASGRWYPTTAEDIGTKMRLPQNRRHGRGAVKGSWSGYTAVGFQLASTMSSLARRGLVQRYSSGRERHVWAYQVTEAGRKELSGGG